MQAGFPAVQLPGFVCIVREEREADVSLLKMAGPEKVQVPAQRGTLISGTMAAAEFLVTWYR